MSKINVRQRAISRPAEVGSFATIAPMILKDEASEGQQRPSLYNHAQNFCANLGIDMLPPKKLPETALPIVDYIHETKPDIVIACDRGARLLGIAVFLTWKNTFKSERFPTIDNKLHFARISKSSPIDSMQNRINQIFDSSLQAAGQPNKEIDSDNGLNVLFIDDWAIGGETQEIAKSLLVQHNARGSWAVLGGKKSDISCIPSFFGPASFLTSWRDNSSQIGIQYKDSANSSYAYETPVAVRSERATRNRKAIARAAMRTSAS